MFIYNPINHFYAFRCAALTSALEPNLLRELGGRCASSSPPAVMMQSPALPLRGTDFRLKLWTLSEGWRWLHTATLWGTAAEMEKELHLSDFESRKQTNKQTHKLTHTNLSSRLSRFGCAHVQTCVSVLGEEPGCICPLLFLQCK